MQRILRSRQLHLRGRCCSGRSKPINLPTSLAHLYVSRVQRGVSVLLEGVLWTKWASAGLVWSRDISSATSNIDN
ncbi:hypothetical protein M378DRAFT_160598 [Amanita muscaria Koide BX008]|uniref:Uncharacterized protein n=1 Tax=Amanita muscaria (strain Koide BX008) TaxID=946122 RepID=A0A0C2XCN7_AMAMK|nr:hypothetical protein M378DRAFT_160598 [Amanita muscaria Koide BX008]